jgi:transcriptional regulator with XRE-family HTH domain
MNRDPEVWARIGRTIASRRAAEGMRQEDLAAKAGVSHRSVQNAELGIPPKARVPQTLYPIAKALDLPDTWIDDVLAGKAPPGEWRDVDVQAVVDEERLESDITNAFVRATEGTPSAEIRAATKAALDVLRQHGLI